MALARTGVVGDISTGDIDILGGGINIGNHGMSDSQVKSIFSSMASMQNSNAQSAKEDTKQMNKVIFISVVVLLLILASLKLLTKKNS